jgi:hypothetical protein
MGLKNQRGKNHPIIIQEQKDYFILRPKSGKIKHNFMIDKEDLPVALSYSWIFSKKNYLVSTIYDEFSKSRQKLIFFHRLITNCPKNSFVDHINGNKLDNRKMNLRICSNTENARNAKPNNDKITKGVTFRKNHTKKIWRARIRVNNKVIHLGDYECLIEAQRAYNIAAIEHFGEFACVVNLGHLKNNLDFAKKSIMGLSPSTDLINGRL